MKRKKLWKRIIAFTLSFSMLCTSAGTGYVAKAAEVPVEEYPVVEEEGFSSNGEAAVETEAVISDETAEEMEESGAAADGAETAAAVGTEDGGAMPASDVPLANEGAADGEAGADVQMTRERAEEASQADTPAETKAEKEITYDENMCIAGIPHKIRIYNARQLQEIGTGNPVRTGDREEGTFGTGKQVSKLKREDFFQVPANGVTYDTDEHYQMEGSIVLSADILSKLPQALSGTFTSNGKSDIPTKLYDEETDTIYIYNNYQLQKIKDNVGWPVMSNDMEAVHFGSGSPVTGANGEAITYSLDHNYVLAKSFTADMPETIAEKIYVGADSRQDGRTFKGQVIWTDEKGTEYILIGNKEQLAAIGSDKDVYSAVYEKEYHVATAQYSIKKDENNNPIMLYGGDADLLLEQNGKDNYDFAGQKDWLATHVCGVDQKTGNISTSASITTGHKYSIKEKYIIFRDINLGNEAWTPLMFSGEMEGRRGMQEGVKATVSNVSINQGEELPMDEYMGVGFFGTIVNQADGIQRLSKGKVRVSNLILDGVSIINKAEKIKHKPSLGQALGGFLSKILTGVGDDPVTFATGGFAGRIYGDAAISGCEVKNLKALTSEKGYAGGFVGNLEGITQYEVVSTLLDVIVSTLSRILNVIPILGLGDLVSILLNGKIINVGDLIPVGYYRPVVENCKVDGILADSIGKSGTDFNGGFVGRQVGSLVKNCEVRSTKALTISGGKFTGGFSGATANAEIKGALNSLGVELVDFPVQSVAAGCTVDVPLTVTGSGKYAGGFSGGLYNSYLVEPAVRNLKGVSGADSVGGLAGHSSIGWGLAVGHDFGAYDSTLLDTVKTLLTGITEGTMKGELLTLIGVSPAKIFGAQVAGSDLTVTASGSYAGGMIGRSDGLTLGKSVQASINDLKPFKKSVTGKDPQIQYEASGRANELSGLKLVSAGKDCAGGLAGKANVASGGGLLDQTLALVNLMKFSLEDITVTGIEGGYTVEAAGNNGAGMIGEAVGGTIKNVQAKELKQVQAKNYAGGFAGTTGTGSLAGTGGLDVLGLGVIKIEGLLGVISAIETRIEESSVTGIQSGYEVKATAGKNAASEPETQAEGENPKAIYYMAGGFLASSASTVVENCKAVKLKYVEADIEKGVAGGFAATSTASSLAAVAKKQGDSIDLGIANISGLLNAVNYMVPKYNWCSVSYVTNGKTAGKTNPQVKADIAGGFAGDFQSGWVNQEKPVIPEEADQPAPAAAELVKPSDYTDAVTGLERVEGMHYAGGFGGKVYAGGLVDGGGLSLLGGLINTNVGNLLSLMNVYMPKISDAGVNGVFSVEASAPDGKYADGSDAGGSYAGGYIGYGSGVEIKGSNVNSLINTTVTEPEDLEDAAAPSYYDAVKSSYAVKAGTYAGGYVGKLDIGSVAGLGDSLSALKILDLASLTQALAVAASSIENSSVTGRTGGYSVLADGKTTGIDKKTEIACGHAGGYAGGVYGSRITRCDAGQIAYIIGRDSAGGFAGTLEPGNVASVVEDVDVLGGLISAKGGLVSLLESFVSFVQLSQVKGIPCGCVIRAEKESSDANGNLAAGIAGGFVGHSLGGQIQGQVDKKETVNGQETTTTETRACTIDRLRSVYGAEYAGGFTGWAECANVADTGSLNILFGLINASNPLKVAEAVYPVENYTRVYGPLRNMTFDEWNGWAEFVGTKGVYGDKISEWLKKSPEERNATYKEEMTKYIYGYNVAAGRKEASALRCHGGVAGGYVGRMDGGIIRNAEANDLAKATAMRSAGGFVGEMRTGSAANAGGIELAGIKILDSLSLIQAFVPVIQNSCVNGYRSGAVIRATGITARNENGLNTGVEVGRAGGYAGYIVGGQIGLKDSSKKDDVAGECSVTMLRSVQGSSYVGGYAGRVESGSALDLNTNDSGLLNQILKYLIDSDDLAKVLDATVTTIRDAKVEAWNDFGILVDGVTKEVNADHSVKMRYADAAGGFAGSIEGAIVGTQENDVSIHGTQVVGIRRVVGGKHVGGYVGLGDAGSALQLSGEGNTTILGKLIELGRTDVANMFRTYIFDAHVTGSVSRGLTVRSRVETVHGTLGETSYSGNTGGFAGSFLNSTVEDSDVKGLTAVSAKNNAGGFIGHSGKSGLVKAEQAQVGGSDGLHLLNGMVGVLDVFGSTVKNCSVAGTADGFTVKTKSGSKEKAGGFVGMADLSRIKNSHVTDIKQVSSDQVAGGFAGETSFAYLASIDVDSALLKKLLIPLLNALLIQLLHLDNITEGNGINIDLGIIKVGALRKGDVLHVNLLGLQIAVSIGKKENDGRTGLLKVAIGDSEILLPYITDEKGNVVIDEKSEEMADLQINLIKANRTKISECSAKGIAVGYDVFGGGAGNDKDGNEKVPGYAGGFVGVNNEGLLEHNNMFYADTIRGTAGKVGEFTGGTSLDSVYDFNTVGKIEGNDNKYRVYRKCDDDVLERAFLKEGVEIARSKHPDDPEGYYVYEVSHMVSADIDNHEDWKDAYQTRTANIVKLPIEVYVSAAQADLMDGTPTEETVYDPEREVGNIQDPCDDRMNIEVQKLWVDENNKDGKRPASVDVTISRTEKSTGETIQDLGGFPKKVTMNHGMFHSDPNLWLYNETVEGNFNYEATEDPVPEGYVAVYDKSADGDILYIENYCTTTVLKKDCVVIDYGQPVDIDVLTNDKEYGRIDKVAENSEKLEAVGAEGDGLTQYTVSETLPSEWSKGTYGSAAVNADQKTIRYTPNTMQMDRSENLLYAVKTDPAKVKNGQNYIYGAVKVIPATMIYYEDNFVQYQDLKIPEGKTAGPEAYGTWEAVNVDNEENAADAQDTDRPGKAQVEQDANSIYGYDTHYTKCKKYSGGTIHKIRVSAETLKAAGTQADLPKATFTFTGTGFDLISLTSNFSGTIVVRLFKGTEATNENLCKNWIVDTFYGYHYNVGSDGKGKWEPVLATETKDEKGLYQIPVVKSEGLEYGTYTAEILPMYADTFDNAKRGYYDFYLDAVRIYDPAAQDAEGYQEIKDVYTQDNEDIPEYKTMRDFLLPAWEAGQKVITGCVFVDGNANEASASDYETYGPKNELYLRNDQAVTFYLMTDEKPQNVQLAMKLAAGDAVKVKICCTAMKDGVTHEYRKTEFTCNTATDLYYELRRQSIWEEIPESERVTEEGTGIVYKYRTRYPILIENITGNDAGILSLTNFTWTGTSQHVQISGQETEPAVETSTVRAAETKASVRKRTVALTAFVDQYAVDAAYEAVAPKHTLTVKYQDAEGTELADPYEERFTGRKAYDAATQVQKEIPGYQMKETAGDSLTGVMDSDKCITVIYEKVQAPETEAPETEATETEAPETEAPETEMQKQTTDMSQPETENKVPETEDVAESVKLSEKKLVMGVKERVSLTAEVLPGAASQEVTWTSSNPKVAVVSAAGKVKAKKTGKAVITATAANGKAASCKVTVKKAPKKLELKATEKTLKKGKSWKLPVKLPKGTASWQMTYRSSKPSIVSVTGKGRAKARKKGTAVITVRTYNGKKAKVKVTVS